MMQSVQFYPSVFILKLSWKLTSPFFTLTGNNSEDNRLMFAFSQNIRIDEGILNIFQLCLQKQNGKRYFISLVCRKKKKNHVLKCALSLLALDSKSSWVLQLSVCVCLFTILLFPELLISYHLKTNRIWSTFPPNFFYCFHFVVVLLKNEVGKMRTVSHAATPTFKRVFKLKKDNVSW